MMQFEKISSRSNQKIKHARNVRDGRVADEIFIEGLRSVREALSASINPISVFVESQFALRTESDEIINSLGGLTSNLFEVDSEMMASIADTNSPQGILVIAKRPASEDAEIKRRLFYGENVLPIAVYLVGVNNPANLGAVARAAEAAGAAGLIISPGSADAFSPKAIRGSMGSLFRLPVWSGAEFDDVAAWCRGSSVVISGTGLQAASSYLEVDWNVPRVLVFGSEGHGLTMDITAVLDETLKIPMEPSVESLNLAVSCAVMLFEARRKVDLKNA